MDLRMAVQKRFGAFFLDVDFSISGERIGIFGPSGGGKSTVVGLLAGLIRPDRGRIALDDEVLFDSDERRNVSTDRRRMGMVFQRPSLFPHLSVKGNLLYGFRRSSVENRKIAFDNVVEVLKIDSLLERGVKHLSGGEKQRVAIGRAVLGNPRLLLLDEPLSALDDNLKFQIVPFLRKACETFKIPYLFISHSLLEMRLMTDKVLRVADGRVAGQESAEELARGQMGSNEAGYLNLLHLSIPTPVDGLYAYEWGGQRLLIPIPNDQPDALFELSSTDIILFKGRPEAISARNLLECTVTNVFPAGNRIGLDLDCRGSTLVAEITEQAIRDLDIRPGSRLWAAIKAAAFRKLG